MTTTVASPIETKQALRVLMVEDSLPAEIQKAGSSAAWRR
jgi:hypothetical protein